MLKLSVAGIYPDKEGMLDKTISLKPKVVVVTVPRSWLFLRIPLALIGIVAKVFKTFRPYIHTQKSIDAKMKKEGYRIKDQEKFTFWVTTTYIL